MRFISTLLAAAMSISLITATLPIFVGAEPAAEPEHIEFSAEEHGALATGTKLVIVTAIDGVKVENNKLYSVTINGEEKDVYYSELYGGIVFIAPGTWTYDNSVIIPLEGETPVVTHGNLIDSLPVSADEGEGDPAEAAVSTPRLTAADAAYISELLHQPDGDYSDLMRIAADYNGDFIATAADCTAILATSIGLNTSN